MEVMEQDGWIDDVALNLYYAWMLDCSGVFQKLPGLVGEQHWNTEDMQTVEVRGVKFLTGFESGAMEIDFGCKFGRFVAKLQWFSSMLKLVDLVKSFVTDEHNDFKDE